MASNFIVNEIMCLNRNDFFPCWLPVSMSSVCVMWSYLAINCYCSIDPNKRCQRKWRKNFFLLYFRALVLLRIVSWTWHTYTLAHLISLHLTNVSHIYTHPIIIWFVYRTMAIKKILSPLCVQWIGWNGLLICYRLPLALAPFHLDEAFFFLYVSCFC